MIQFEQAWKFVHPEPRPSTPVPALCFPQLHMKVAEVRVPAQDTTSECFGAVPEQGLKLKLVCSKFQAECSDADLGKSSLGVLCRN